VNASQTSRIAAGTGRAFDAPKKHIVEVVSPEGPQVADTWAFALPGLDEFLSTEHTRSCLDRLAPCIGEAFYSNRCRPILTVVQDTSPGCYDLLLSACGGGRYSLLGHQVYHANCVDNLGSVLQKIGMTALVNLSSVNVFENVSIDAEEKLRIEPPLVQPGQRLHPTGRRLISFWWSLRVQWTLCR